MNPATACCAETIALHRPWWLRALDAWRAWRGARTPHDPYAELRHLSDETLRDIGVADFVRGDRGQRDRWLLDTRNW